MNTDHSGIPSEDSLDPVGFTQVTRYEIGGSVTRKAKTTHPVRMTFLWIALGLVLPQVLSFVLTLVLLRVVSSALFLFWVQYATTFFAPPIYVAAWWLALRRPLRPSAVVVPTLVVFLPNFLMLVWVAMQQAYYGVSGRVFGMDLSFTLLMLLLKIAQILSVFVVLWMFSRCLRIRLSGQEEKGYAKPLGIRDIMVASVVVAVCLSLEKWLPYIVGGSPTTGQSWFFSSVFSGLFVALLWAVTSCVWVYRRRRLVMLGSVVAFLLYVSFQGASSALTFYQLTSQSVLGGTVGVAGFVTASVVSSALSVAGILLVFWVAESHGYRLRVAEREPTNATGKLNLTDDRPMPPGESVLQPAQSSSDPRAEN
ncbi:MAG: hypothetical protein AB8B50_21555 [Pirellulaceae bacterium]